MAWEPDYLTLQEAKSFLQVDGTVDDDEIEEWISVASRAIDRRCNRQFGQLADPATFTYTDAPVYVDEFSRWLLQIDDLQDATGLTINGTAYLSQTAAILWPLDAVAKGRVYTHLSFPSTPTWSGLWTLGGVRWGWSTLPKPIKGACRLQVNRFHARRGAPFGVAGSPANGGSEMRLLARLDPDVAVALAGWSRPRRAG